MFVTEEKTLFFFTLTHRDESFQIFLRIYSFVEFGFLSSAELFLK